ncbi:MAG: hypothetical protein LBL77_02260 [Endomicrobium sp.]|jgi:hypothetical protein|nr:hypothetical protein [Endomicrobium sp.]
MKKYLLITLIIVFAINNTICSRNFVERIDYFVEFQEKTPKMAATLRVNFINDVSNPEEIVKNQLKKYGQLLISNKKAFTVVKKEIKYKNIIGSAWYINNIDPKNPIKIKFQKNLGAYVWLGKTRTIVPFPNYISFLKKEHKNSKK